MEYSISAVTVLYLDQLPPTSASASASVVLSCTFLGAVPLRIRCACVCDRSISCASPYFHHWPGDKLLIIVWSPNVLAISDALVGREAARVVRIGVDCPLPVRDCWPIRRVPTHHSVIVNVAWIYPQRVAPGRSSGLLHVIRLLERVRSSAGVTVLEGVRVWSLGRKWTYSRAVLWAEAERGAHAWMPAARVDPTHRRRFMEKASDLVVLPRVLCILFKYLMSGKWWRGRGCDCS